MKDMQENGSLSYAQQHTITETLETVIRVQNQIAGLTEGMTPKGNGEDNPIQIIQDSLVTLIETCQTLLTEQREQKEAIASIQQGQLEQGKMLKVMVASLIQLSRNSKET